MHTATFRMRSYPGAVNKPSMELVSLYRGVNAATQLQKILHSVSVSLLLLSAAARADASTFTVNSTVDGDDANKGNGICATAGGVCTLRAAISEATSFTGGPHSVSIPAGTYLLTGTVNENSNVGGDLNISKPMTIAGAGVDSTIIDGNGADRVIAVEASSVTLSGFTAQNGNAPAGQSRGGIQYGGSGLLTLDNIKITGCEAFDGGGLISNSGDMTITNLTISNCSADRKGGALHQLREPAHYQCHLQQQLRRNRWWWYPHAVWFGYRIDQRHH